MKVPNKNTFYDKQVLFYYQVSNFSYFYEFYFNIFMKFFFKNYLSVDLCIYNTISSFKTVITNKYMVMKNYHRTIII